MWNIPVVDLSDPALLAGASDVRKLLHIVFLLAVKDRASEIRFEPQGEQCKMTYCVGGTFYEMVPAPVSAMVIVWEFMLLARLGLIFHPLKFFMRWLARVCGDHASPAIEGRVRLVLGDYSVGAHVAVHETESEGWVIVVLDHPTPASHLARQVLEEHFKMVAATRQRIDMPSPPTLPPPARLPVPPPPSGRMLLLGILLGTLEGAVIGAIRGGVNGACNVAALGAFVGLFVAIVSSGLRLRVRIFILALVVTILIEGIGAGMIGLGGLAIARVPALEFIGIVASVGGASILGVAVVLFVVIACVRHEVDAAWVGSRLGAVTGGISLATVFGVAMWDGLTILTTVLGIVIGLPPGAFYGGIAGMGLGAVFARLARKLGFLPERGRRLYPSGQRPFPPGESSASRSRQTSRIVSDIGIAKKEGWCFHRLKVANKTDTELNEVEVTIIVHFQYGNWVQIECSWEKWRPGEQKRVRILAAGGRVRGVDLSGTASTDKLLGTCRLVSYARWGKTKPA